MIIRKLPKKLIGATIITLAFVVGAAVSLNGQPSQPVKTQALKFSSDNAAAASVTQPSPEPTTNTSATTRIVSSDDPVAQSSDSTPTTDTTTPQTPADNQAVSDPVTAVSATLSDWSDPEGTNNSQIQYCMFTYSDGSTKQVMYETKTSSPKSNMQGGASVETVGYGAACTLANAPAPN